MEGAHSCDSSPGEVLDISSMPHSLLCICRREIKRDSFASVHGVESLMIVVCQGHEKRITLNMLMLPNRVVQFISTVSNYQAVQI